MTDRNLFSQHAEEAVLSILLKNPEYFEEIPDLKHYMFSSIPNEILFETLHTLKNDGLNPDYNLLVTTLQSRNQLHQCGGESFIEYLVNKNYDAHNLREFIRIIIKSYKARNVISITNEVQKMMFSSDDVDNTINYIQKQLESLVASGSAEEIQNMEFATKDAWENIIDRVNNPNKIEFTTNLNNLDLVTGGYWKGDLWVIAGRPGMGKSAFMCNSVTSGIPSLIFSLEMSRIQIINRLISINSGVPIFNIRMGILDQKQLDNISDTIKNIKLLPIFIDTSFVRDVDYISSTIRKYKNSYGIEITHLDYIQLLAERSNESTHELGRITRTLKLLAKDLQITNVFYSQLNRLVELRDDKRPILSDLRQSGNIEEDVDLAVFLYRDEMYNPTTKDLGVLELLVRKQRNGPTGVVFSRFDKETNRIIEKK